MTHPKKLALAASVALAAVAPAPAWATGSGSEPVAAYDGHEVSQHGGLAAWSRQDADGYHLVADGGSGAFDVPVAPQPRPWDLDVGTDADGSRTVVASICQGAGLTPTPGSCDVARVDLDSGAIRPVPLASAPGVDEVSPTISQGTVAWGREAGGKATVRLAGPKATTAKTVDIGAIKARRVDDLDLVPAGLAASVEGENGELPGAQYAVYKPANKTPRLVAKWGEGEEHIPSFSVSFANDGLWIGAQNQDQYANEVGLLAHYDLTTAKLTGLDFGPFVASVSADAGLAEAPLLAATHSGVDGGSDAIVRLTQPELGPLAGPWKRIFAPR